MLLSKVLFWIVSVLKDVEIALAPSPVLLVKEVLSTKISESKNIITPEIVLFSSKLLLTIETVESRPPITPASESDSPVKVRPSN